MDIIYKCTFFSPENARLLVSNEKKQFQPLSMKEQNPLTTIGNALKDILPNACLYTGMF